MTELERLEQGKKEAEDALALAEANFDPYEGRTFIPKMSPGLKKMLVDSIRKARRKGEDRKEDRLIENKRKKRLRKLMLRRQDREGMKKATPTAPTQIENPLLEKELMTAKYGGKILKKYRR